MGAMLIYAEEALDDVELESGKLKKENVGDVIIGAFKKAKLVTIVEPAEATGSDMDDDVTMHAGHGVGRDLHQPVRQG
jgi:hypothetical protein